MKALVFVVVWVALSAVVGTVAALLDWNTHDFTLAQHYGYSLLLILGVLCLTVTIMVLAADNV